MIIDHVKEYNARLNHELIADLAHMLYKNNFLATVDTLFVKTTTQWYEFIHGDSNSLTYNRWKWCAIPKPFHLDTLISRDIRGLISAAMNILREHGESDKFVEKLNASKLILGSRSYKNSVLEECAYRFNDIKAVTLFDKNPVVFGVGNGVLHLPVIDDKTPPYLIQSPHSFYITKTTRVRYQQFDPKDEKTIILLNAIADIPEIDVRIWILFHLGSGLYRGTKDSPILLLKGGGCNGKSLLMKMTQSALGPEYSIKLPITLLTSQRENPNQANSACMGLKDKGFAYFEESNMRDILNTARLKDFVSTGDISCRDLHKKQEIFKLTSSLIACSNYDFIIKSSDNGTWRRIRYYSMKTKFCNTPDPLNQHEKQDNPLFMTKYPEDPEFQSAFLSILVHFWTRLVNEYDGQIKNVISLNLEHETELYRNSQDVLNLFIYSRFCIIRDTDDHYEDLKTFATSFIHLAQNNNPLGTPSETLLEITVSDLENSVISKMITTDRTRNVRVVKNCMKISVAEELDVEIIPISRPKCNYHPRVHNDVYEWWNQSV